MSGAPPGEASPAERLSIVYLLEDTPLFGGVKVVLQQADLLARLGHAVTIVSPGEPPTWFDLEATFHRTPGLNPEHIPRADIVVATYWTTIARARAVVEAGGATAAVHYCQGYEATYTHNRADHPAIQAAYTTDLPALVVAPHLATMLADTYGRAAKVVPQPLDPSFRPRFRRRPRRPPRILITSPFEIDWKGVSIALEAVAHLRRDGYACEVIRLSQWPQSDDEKSILEADTFHHHVPPAAVPAIFADCDLLIAASWEAEGFGLPVLEAMGCGVPVVASDIAAFRDYASEAAVLVPWDSPEAFATAARSLLDHPGRWRAHRRAGLRVARTFNLNTSAQAAEKAMRWVLAGAP